MSLSPRAALMVIDVQQGLDDPRIGERNNPGAEERIAELLAAWRATGRPVIHVQHLSLDRIPRCEETARQRHQARGAARAGEPVFKKHVNSAFIGTGLEAHLRGNGIEDSSWPA